MKKHIKGFLLLQMFISIFFSLQVVPAAPRCRVNVNNRASMLVVRGLYKARRRVNNAVMLPVDKNPLVDAIQNAKSKLKPVAQKDKNVFAKMLAERKDYYDAKADLQSFIKN